MSLATLTALERLIDRGTVAVTMFLGLALLTGLNAESFEIQREHTTRDHYAPRDAARSLRPIGG